MKAEQGWQVVGTVGLEQCSSESAVVPCSDFKMSRPTLLLMGNSKFVLNVFGLIIVLLSLCYGGLSVCVLSGGEGDGLSPELHQMCDVLLTIPPHRNLHPGVDSLNVSVATGMFI